MKNWKTTSTGITMIVGGIVGLYYAWKNGHLNEGTITAALSGILGGIGLVYAKDHNVSGTVQKNSDELPQDPGNSGSSNPGGPRTQ